MDEPGFPNVEAGWAAKLLVARWWRKLVPALLVRTAWRPVSALLVRVPAVRTMCERHLRIVLTGTDREGDVHGLAPAYLYEVGLRYDMFWRDRVFERAHVENSRRIEEALEHKAGVLLVTLHMTIPSGLVAALKSEHGGCSTAVSPEAYQPVTNGLTGYECVRARRIVQRYGRGVNATGSYAVFEHELRVGGVVALTFDVPGRTPTPMLGRTMMLASGTSRLALATGATVLPVRPVRRGSRLVFEVLPPVDLQETTLEEAQSRIARALEPVMLAAPELSDRPAYRWAPASDQTPLHSSD